MMYELAKAIFPWYLAGYGLVAAAMSAWLLWLTRKSHR